MRSVLVLRGLALWACVRLMLAVMRLLLTIVNGASMLEPGSFMIGVVPLVILLGMIDVGRRREWGLLGNLGVSRGSIVAWLGAPALAAEMALSAAI